MSTPPACAVNKIIPWYPKAAQRASRYPDKYPVSQNSSLKDKEKKHGRAQYQECRTTFCIAVLLLLNLGKKDNESQ